MKTQLQHRLLLRLAMVMIAVGLIAIFTGYLAPFLLVIALPTPRELGLRQR